MLSLNALVKSGMYLCPRANLYTKQTICFSTSRLNIKSSNKHLLWQTTGLTTGQRAPTQILFQDVLQSLFPEEDIQKEMNIKPPGYGYLEVDAYIPRLKLPVEYQDPFHYTPTVYYANRPLAEIQELDSIKKRIIDERGEPLVRIPCWWNGESDSLAASIKAIRPDLLKHLTPSCPPITDKMPDNFFQVQAVPGVGTPMRPVFFSEQYYQRGRKWLMSEKYDGVRGIWNSANRTDKYKYSRLGNKLHFPDNFKQLMPNEILDGEVWGGIGQFQEATKLQSNATKAFPADVKYVVFDLADPESQKLPYAERYRKLLLSIDSDHPFLLVPSRILEESEKKRHKFEKLIAKGGGEGLMLTEGNSPYECGNTDKVLKIKPERDTEVLVISCDNKSLTVETADSTRFRIITPKQLERELPKPGDVVTITFKRYVNCSTLPHRPAIKRIRRDLTWDEVKALSNDHHVPRSDVRNRNFSERWDIDIGGTREHLVQFAKKRGFDPLVPDNWYQISGKEIFAVKGAPNMLREFCGSFIDALVASFPELSFDKSKFLYIPRHHWENTQNVKAWFDNFARTKGFDPLIADNWYNFTRDDICGEKRGMLKYHGESHFKALKATYPDIGLDETKFAQVPRWHWLNAQNTKAWFDDFARMKGFDPLIADNWYNFTYDDICGEKGGYGMLKHHGQSYIKALRATYPDIRLDESKFSQVPRRHWSNAQNVKAWFDDFARTKGFDPLIADNWYDVACDDICGAKPGLLKHYGQSHIKALKATYPDIGLDEFKFSRVPSNYWKNKQNTKAWFDNFARTKGFDPLVAENWYKVSLRDIRNQKGGFGMLKYHGRGYIRALKATYPDIGLDGSKFSKVSRNYWTSIQNARAWLDEFANKKGFDPLAPENWGKVSHSHIHAVKGGPGLLASFNGSLKKVLSEAYSSLASTVVQ